MKYTLLLLFAFIGATQLFSQPNNIERKAYTTTRIVGEAPHIDGLIEDEAWDLVEWGGGDFTQRQPDDGAAPSVQTKFKILYDEKNLYIAFLCLDPEPDKIVSRLSRRDGFDGDRVEINIDSYNDKRTAFSFTSSVSGVKGDEYVSNNGDNWDSNWDPIWYLKTSINSEGWIAEVKIPLSQLRFSDKDVHTWGIQIMRVYFRNEERSNWQYIPQDASGWVHLFGELNGLQGIKSQKQLEIQPYIVASTETFEREEGNPFATGKTSDLTMGLDAKIGITSDITLDLTVNPDFGQVEADPSQVNLTAFQLFFPEQRPFFIEGNNILTFPISDANNDNLFYSRRIGRRPQIRIDTDDDGEDNVQEYVKKRNNTRILSSMKLTGKNKHGFSWGLLESVTHKEEAEIDSLGYRRKETVEPFTNYLVGRVQQDLNGGQTIFGGMFTATNRSNLEPKAEIVDEAYSGGVDFTHYMSQRKFFVSGKVVSSKVMGDARAIERLQYSPVHFFQRTNNDYEEVDSTKTSLSGTGGSLLFGKRSGQIIYDVGGSWSSPELELNDIGFVSQSDKIAQWIWVQYRKLNPFSIFRTMRVNFNQRQEWDFGGDELRKNFNINTNIDFTNLWSMGSGLNYNKRASNADLRGGPSIVYPGSYGYWIWVGTNSRKKVRFEINPWWDWGLNDFSKTTGLWTALTIRPTDALNIRLIGSVEKSFNEMQYIGTAEFNNENRYIIGKINQTVYDFSLRLTYVLTPNLSIQYWGQPFAATGTYSNFKRVTNSTAEKYDERFTPLSATYNEDNQNIEIDENGDNLVDYTIGKPDFNFAQFRSNMVLRWEYTPGSTLFLVWNQSRSDAASLDRNSYDHLYGSLFDRTPHNIFLVKYTYRFLL